MPAPGICATAPASSIYPAKLEAALKAHELAHCNGWRHDPEVQLKETDAAIQRKKFYEWYNKLYPPSPGAPHDWHPGRRREAERIWRR
jgi:hypothetical protein